jgi:hypothetical protein
MLVAKNSQLTELANSRLLQQSIPLRHHSLHVINARSIASGAYNMIKPVLPDKICKRVSRF